MEVMIVDNNACNDKCFTALVLSLFSNLKVFEVGDYSFSFVDEVKLIGLNRLERVLIGDNCFTKKKKKGTGNDPNRHFQLENCSQLKELKIGRYSFMDYSMCEIENMPSLEVIEMGELNEGSSNFHHASLELKSDSQ